MPGSGSSSLSKVELVAAIRRDLRNGISRRAIQGKYQVSWHTVDEAAGSVWPTERERYPRRQSKVDQYAAVIDAILHADLDAPRKQCHSVRRIHSRLMNEHGMADVSYARVRA